MRGFVKAEDAELYMMLEVNGVFAVLPLTDWFNCYFAGVLPLNAIDRQAQGSNCQPNMFNMTFCLNFTEYGTRSSADRVT